MNFAQWVGKFIPIKLSGNDGNLFADVVRVNRSNRLLVDAQVQPVPLGQLFTEKLELNGSGSTDIAINPGGTPDEFILPFSNDDRIVTSINVFGRDNGIQFGRFLGQNSNLSGGLIFEVKSEDQVFQFIPIKTTDDFRNVFCETPSDFVVDFASGEDAFTASFIPSVPFYIRKQTQFSSPDYVKIIVQDNISNINYLESICKGAFDV